MAYTVAQMRVEMGRLVQVMMAKNKQYLAREAELERLYADEPDVLATRLCDDYVLNKAGGAAKSCAVLISAIASAISAEIAFFEHQYRSGRDARPRD